MTDDELVFAIDLRREALREVEHDLETANETSAPRPLPPVPHRPIGRVALLLDGRDEPLLLPIAPTRDARFLDALARLIRVASVLKSSVPEVARRFGAPYEQGLVTQGRLPGWASGNEPFAPASLQPTA